MNKKEDKLLKRLMRSRGFQRLTPAEKNLELNDYKWQKEHFNVENK
jgi:hypothetical protein